MKKKNIIILVTFVIWILSCIIYIVPESNYTITDQTQEIRLKDYPELKEISFMYSTDLYIEYTEPINLELEKINFRINDEVIGTAEINKNINELEDFAEPYIDEKTKEKIIRKIYPLQKEFLRILGRNAEIYNSLGDGMFYLNIYIKDLKTNKIFVINRNKIFIDFESAGPKVFIPNI